MEIRVREFLIERMSRFGDKTALVCGGRPVSYLELIHLVQTESPQTRSFAPVVDGDPLEQAVEILKNLATNAVVVPLHRAYGDAYCNSILDELKNYSAPDLDSDIALVLFTSGSTGKPKGAMLSHENIISNLKAIDAYFKVDEADKILIARPLMHCAVLTGELLFGLYKGLEIHFYNEPFMPDRIAAYIENHGITTFGCTPTLLNLLKSPLAKSGKTQLKNLVVSGETMSADAAVLLFQCFPDLNIYSVYGLTEASPRVSALDPADFKRKPGSIGKPIRNVKMKLSDEQKCETHDGCTGRLLVKSPGIMRGYLGNDSLSKTKIVDGWLDTGDIARRDGEGYYYITGRADNMIIRSGMNIYPEEMEALLKKDGRIKECLYFAETDAVIGKRICIKIVGEIDRYEACRICRELLPSFALPQRVEIVSAIEKTASGKVRRL